MKRSLTIISVLLLLSFAAFGQETHTGFVPGKQKFRPYLAFNGGINWAVINNRKEVRGVYKPGLSGGISWYTSPWFNITAEYSWFLPHNSSPSFENIHAWNSELNCNLFMGIGQTKLKFRTLFGLSYMNWKGTFIGPSLNDNNKYYYGLVVGQHWLAGNLGCGVSRMIYSNLNATAGFRMRFASEEKDLVSISDTAFDFGLSWQLKKRAVKTDDNSGAYRKTTKNRSGRLYKWMKKGA
jgi:hypothetical protein